MQKKLRETNDLLYIDKIVVREVHSRLKNVAMTQKDNEKTYDIVGLLQSVQTQLRVSKPCKIAKVRDTELLNGEPFKSMQEVEIHPICSGVFLSDHTPGAPCPPSPLPPNKFACNIKTKRFIG